MSNRGSAFFNGRVYTGAELKDQIDKRGLCPKCAEHVVKRRTGRWTLQKEPITVGDEQTGYTVYKGYCIQPTCYTLEQAKKLLGERTRSGRSEPRFIDAVVTPVGDGTGEPSSPPMSPGSQEPAAPSTDIRIGPTITQNNDRRSESERPAVELIINTARAFQSEPSLVSHPLDDTSVAEAKIENEEMGWSTSLRETAKRRDFATFLDDFNMNHFKKNFAKEGFRVLREEVIKIHKTNPSTRVFTSHNWVKTIKGAFEAKAPDEETITQGLLLFMSLAGVSPTYRRDLLQYPTVDAILNARRLFRHNQEIEDLCCACLEVFFADNQDREWKLKSASLASAIDELITMMRTRKTVDKNCFALRALFNLSRQEHLVVNGVSVADYVHATLADSSGVEVLVGILQGEDLSHMVAEAALSLLWRMSLPAAISDAETFQSGSSILPTENIIQVVIKTMKTHESSPLTQQAGCGILGNLMLPSLNLQQYPPSLAKPTLVAVTNSLSRRWDLSKTTDNKTLQMVQLNGILAIHNLLCNAKLRDAVASDSDALLSSVVKSMKLLKEKPVIQSVGCMALSRVCGMGLQQKREVLSSGAVVAVSDAFRKFVKYSNSEEKNTSSIFDGASTIAASLSMLPEASSELVLSDLVADIQEVFQRDPTIASDPSARRFLMNTNTNTNSSHPNELLSNIIETSSNAAAVESCFSSLASAAVESDEYLNTLLVCRDGNGLRSLLDLMERFANCPGVQQDGIAILALLYSNYPFTGVLGNFTRIGAVNIKSHTEREVEVIRNAMLIHRTHAGVQENVFRALCNFIAPICGKAKSFGPTSRLFASSFEDIQEAIVSNEHAPSVHKSAMVFFGTLTFVCRESDLQLWGFRITQLMFDCMRQAPTDDEMQLIGCDALLAFLQDEGRFEFVSSTELFETMFECFTSTNAVVVASACEIVSTLLSSNHFAASEQILEVEHVVKRLITCMNTYMASEEIQRYLCSIIKSLLMLQGDSEIDDDSASESEIEDYSVRGSIARCGGLKAILESASKHQRNQGLVLDAVLAMKGITDALTSKIITPMQSQLRSFIIRAVEDYMDNPDLEAALFDFIFVLCKQHEYFKELASDSGFIPQVVDVMNQHLFASDLQTAGCSILWALSSFRDTKLLIGRSGGIRSIVNAMNAHTEKTALQKEALTALKNLSTAPENSERLTKCGAENAVIRVLWINMNFSNVLVAGFAALNNLAVDSRDRSVAPMQPVTLQLIIHSMRRFPSNQEVQKYTVLLLKSYSFSEVNLRLMATEHWDDLVPLLAEAEQRFPYECRDRAGCVMRKIEQAGVAR